MRATTIMVIGTGVVELKPVVLGEFRDLLAKHTDSWVSKPERLATNPEIWQVQINYLRMTEFKADLDSVPWVLPRFVEIRSLVDEQDHYETIWTDVHLRYPEKKS